MEEKNIGAIHHAIKTELAGLFTTKKDAATETIKTLILLLDTAKKEFSLNAFTRLAIVEKIFKLERFELAGCKKAACFFFQLSDEEKVDLKNDLLEILKSNGFDFENTLEGYLKKRLGVEESEKLDSIENPLEDFCFNINQETSRSEIKSLVKEYYEIRGYEEVPSHWDVCVKKNDDLLGITISCWSYFSKPETQILVTVSPIPKPPKRRKRKAN